jgi:23S rRNA (uracil1939-C5)-methyltransferase
MSRLCTHFGTCGGCSFQDLPKEAYAQTKRDLVIQALVRNGFDDVRVDAPVEVAPHTRRRAMLAFAMSGGAAELGFSAARSHAIVDLHECLVLRPSLVSVILSFRNLVPSLLRAGEQGELRLTECDNGIDLTLNLPRKSVPQLSHILADWARRNNVARIVANDEIVVQFDKPVIRLADVEIAVPPNSFLQPTREGEHILQDLVHKALKGVTRVADLYAGCGTFSFVMARRASVCAIDSDKSALAALQSAVRGAQKLKPVTTEVRNLFSLPLQRAELRAFDAAILDPPRAGASAQAAMLANSSLRKLAYVSCNPETFARDARILSDGGFEIAWVKPVDQFLWSSHIELVALLERH